MQISSPLKTQLQYWILLRVPWGGTGQEGSNHKMSTFLFVCCKW